MNPIPPCRHCARAAVQDDYPLYVDACQDCVVRAFSCGYPFWHADERRPISPVYRQTLECAFGEQWAQGHERVRAEARRARRADGTASRRLCDVLAQLAACFSPFSPNSHRKVDASRALRWRKQ